MLDPSRTVFGARAIDGEGCITVSYLSNVTDLGYLFSRIPSSVNSGVGHDWVGLGANIGAVAGKAVASYAKQTGALKTALETVGKKVLPTPTAIIDVTMVAVTVVDLLNGFGAPDAGAGFAGGIDKLKAVDSKVELALPDSRDWSGAAADAYVAQVVTLRALLVELQNLDKQMQTLVADQGARVKQAHQTLAVLGLALIACQGAAMLMYLIPVVGPEVSFLFQVAVALAATTTVVVQETLVIGESGNTSSAIGTVAAGYVALGKRAELGGAFGVIEVAGAQEAKVGSFTAISDGLSRFSAMPTVASLAAKVGDAVPEQTRAMLAALDSPEAIDGVPVPVPTPGTDVVPDVPVTPSSPVFTPPTMAQLNQMSAQMAKFSSNVAQPLNVVNQTMGSVQQVVSMAQQGQGAGVSAAEMTPVADEFPAEPGHAELADDVHVEETGEPEDRGAAAAEAGERAPIDAAMAAGEQTPGPGSERPTP